VDRGPDDMKVLDTMMRLQLEAPTAGGRIVTLVGNHEMMVIGGSLRYVCGASLEAYGGRDGVKALMAPTGKYGKWIRSFPLFHVAMRTVFVHAYLQSKFLDPAVGASRELLEKVWNEHHHQDEHHQDASVSALPAVYKSGFSAIYWDRPWWGGDIYDEIGNREEVNADLRKTLSFLDADRIVTGHTPVSEPHVSPGKDYYLMDIGMSRWMSNGRPHYLDLREMRAGAVASDAAGDGITDSTVKNGIRATVCSVQGEELSRESHACNNG
jgi:hypothetical protein